MSCHQLPCEWASRQGNRAYSVCLENVPKGSCAEGRLGPQLVVVTSSECSDFINRLISCSGHSGINWSLHRWSPLGEKRSPEDKPLIDVSYHCSTVSFPTPLFLSLGCPRVSNVVSLCFLCHGVLPIICLTATEPAGNGVKPTKTQIRKQADKKALSPS